MKFLLATLLVLGVSSAQADSFPVNGKWVGTIQRTVTIGSQTQEMECTDFQVFIQETKKELSTGYIFKCGSSTPTHMGNPTYAKRDGELIYGDAAIGTIGEGTFNFDDGFAGMNVELDAEGKMHIRGFENLLIFYRSDWEGILEKAQE
jgi:hypothetical protein